MSSVQVRPFRRADRDQLTALVNAHIQAVVPGVSVSVNTVMSQLERDPGEFIVDPWVTERAALVAEQRGRVVAAAHLLRYGSGEEVGEAYRGTAEINWLLYWPRAMHWLDSEEAAGALVDACLERLRSWGVTHWHADGALPAPGVYGVPEQWPHIRALYERIAVRFPWKAGDILMVDNMLVAHARAPFTGARKIVVAMGEMIDQQELKA